MPKQENAEILRLEAELKQKSDELLEMKENFTLQLKNIDLKDAEILRLKIELKKKLNEILEMKKNFTLRLKPLSLKDIEILRFQNQNNEKEEDLNFISNDISDELFNAMDNLFPNQSDLDLQLDTAMATIVSKDAEILKLQDQLKQKDIEMLIARESFNLELEVANKIISEQNNEILKIYNQNLDQIIQPFKKQKTLNADPSYPIDLSIKSNDESPVDLSVKSNDESPIDLSVKSIDFE